MARTSESGHWRVPPCRGIMGLIIVAAQYADSLLVGRMVKLLVEPGTCPLKSKSG